MHGSDINGRMEPYFRFIEDELKKTDARDCPPTHPSHRVFAEFLTDTFTDPDNPEQRNIAKENRLMLHYLLEALISR